MTLAATLLTQLAVSRMLGATALGLFFLAVKLAYVPTDAAQAVVGAVAFPMFSRLRGDTVRSTRAYLMVLTGLHLLLLPVCALIFVLAPQLESVLGDRWDGTAPIVQILCIAAAGGVVVMVLNSYLMGQGNSKGAFTVEALYTTVLLAVLVPCLLLWQVCGAAVAWLVGSLVTMILSAYWSHRLVPGALRSARRGLLAALAISLVAAAAASFASAPWVGLSAILAGGTAGLVAGALTLWWLNAVLKLQLQDLLMLVRRNDG
jgi:PST family polysaccharide transporter